MPQAGRRRQADPHAIGFPPARSMKTAVLAPPCGGFAQLGAEVTDSLVIKSITFLPPDADFLDAGDGLESADARSTACGAAAIDAGIDGGLPRTGTPAGSEGLTSTEAFSCDSGAPPTRTSSTSSAGTSIPGRRLRVHFRASTPRSAATSGSAAPASGWCRPSPVPVPSVEGFSAAVRGDTIVVRFKADSSITANGFAIDQIEHDLAEQCAAGERR